MRKPLPDESSYLQQLLVHQSYYQHLQKLVDRQLSSPIQKDGEKAVSLTFYFLFYIVKEIKNCVMMERKNKRSEEGQKKITAENINTS